MELYKDEHKKKFKEVLKEFVRFITYGRLNLKFEHYHRPGRFDWLSFNKDTIGEYYWVYWIGSKQIAVRIIELVSSEEIRRLCEKPMFINNDPQYHLMRYPRRPDCNGIYTRLQGGGVIWTSICSLALPRHPEIYHFPPVKLHEEKVKRTLWRMGCESGCPKCCDNP